MLAVFSVLVSLKISPSHQPGEVTKSTTPDAVWFQQGHLPRGYLAVLDRQIAAAEKKNDSPLKKGQH
jgi:hypothetical protein